MIKLYRNNVYIRTLVNTIGFYVLMICSALLFHVLVRSQYLSKEQSAPVGFYSTEILQREVDSIKQYKLILQQEYDSLLREEQKHKQATPHKKQ